MGCSATKNMTVEPTDGHGNITNGNYKPPIDDHVEAPPDSSATVNNVQKNPNGLSFEITFDEDKDESIIQKHPPKRLQKLEEQQQPDPQVTLDKLQEKLEEAEKRREQILQQRVQSAKMKNLRKQSTVESDEDDNLLKVPKS